MTAPARQRRRPSGQTQRRFFRGGVEFERGRGSFCPKNALPLSSPVEQKTNHREPRHGKKQTGRRHVHRGQHRPLRPLHPAAPGGHRLCPGRHRHPLPAAGAAPEKNAPARSGHPQECPLPPALRRGPGLQLDLPFRGLPPYGHRRGHALLLHGAGLRHPALAPGARRTPDPPQDRLHPAGRAGGRVHLRRVHRQPAGPARHRLRAGGRPALLFPHPPQQASARAGYAGDHLLPALHRRPGHAALCAAGRPSARSCSRAVHALPAAGGGHRPHGPGLYPVLLGCGPSPGPDHGRTQLCGSRHRHPAGHPLPAPALRPGGTVRHRPHPGRHPGQRTAGECVCSPGQRSRESTAARHAGMRPPALYPVAETPLPRAAHAGRPRRGTKGRAGSSPFFAASCPPPLLPAGSPYL